MRNGMKRAALGLAAAALCLGLMGCSLSSGFADYDVSGYFQALLDSSYKNQNENYATVAATTEENAQQNNTTTVRNAAVNFCNTYGVTPSDDQLSQLQEVMSQALAKASYTVQDEVKTETGYTLEIVIDPIVNFSDMGDDIRQLRNQAQDEATQANSSASDEEDSYGSEDSYDESSDGDSYDSYDDYGSDDYGYGGDSSEDSSSMEDQDSSLGVGEGEEPVDANELFVDKVVELCQEQLSSLRYSGETVTITLDIRQTEEGELQLDTNQLDTIDRTVLQFQS